MGTSKDLDKGSSGGLRFRASGLRPKCQGLGFRVLIGSN